MYVSGVFCPCDAMIAWLESIARGAQCCGFAWEAEGPDGRISLDHDRFTAEWLTTRRGGAITALVDRRQLVAAFYQSFRRFLRSAAYEPARYERMTLREELALTNQHGQTEAELVGHAIMLDRSSVEAWLRGMRPIGLYMPAEWLDQPGSDSASLATDSRDIEPVEWSPEFAVIGASYTSRHSGSQEIPGSGVRTFSAHSLPGSGLRGAGGLREMWSKIVEDWLGWGSPEDSGEVVSVKLCK